MGFPNRNLSSSITSCYWRLFLRRIQTVLYGITIVILLGFNPMVIQETLCGRIHQRGSSSIFRSQIGTVTTSVVVRCCFVYINYRSVISDVVVMTTINGQSHWMLKVLRAFIPKCVRRSRIRAFIFLLLMEDNPLEKLHELIIRTFYVWSLKNVNKRIVIMDLSWVIFTTKTMSSPSAGDGNDCMIGDVTDGSQSFDFQKKFWSFIKDMIAKEEDQIRLKTETIKKINRLINLLACKAYPKKGSNV